MIVPLPLVIVQTPPAGEASKILFSPEHIAELDVTMLVFPVLSNTLKMTLSLVEGHAPFADIKY